MRLIFKFLPIFIVVFSSQVFAWGDMGHRLVGVIAEEAMTEDARSFVRGIVGIEPLSVAAVFPDLVRDDARFGTKTPTTDNIDHDFSVYHYCEIPVGYNYDNRPKKIQKDCHGVIKYTTKLLKDSKASREAKMIALRYLVHVVGDVHQPLHVGNGYDRGGNGCTVKWKKSGSDTETQMNLHSFWDEVMIDELRESFAKSKKTPAPKYLGEFVSALKAKHPELLTANSKKKYGAGSVTDWLEESQKLRDTIYPDAPGSMDIVKKGEEYKNRPYCVWYLNQDKDKTVAPGSKVIESKIPVLTAAYSSKHQEVVELQIFKAGLRLASILDQVAAETKEKDTHRIDDKEQESILKLVHDTLRNIL